MEPRVLGDVPALLAVAPPAPRHGELGHGPNAAGRWCAGCRRFHGASYLCHHFTADPAILARITAASVDTARALARGRLA